MGASIEKQERNILSRHEIASLFESGYALTSDDFAEVYKKNRLSPSTGRCSLTTEINNGYFTTRTEVEVASVKVGRRLIFFMKSLDPHNDTDFDHVASIIKIPKPDIKPTSLK